MTLEALYTVQRRAWVTSDAPDTHGNVGGSLGAPTDLAVYGWAPPNNIFADENTDGRTQSIIKLQLLAPAGTPVDPRDQFIVDGVAYDVVGFAEDFTHSPFGFAPGIRINLKHSEG